MRLAWAIAAGLLLGIGVGWWFSRESPEHGAARERRAQQAAAAQAQDARRVLYRWRDEDGVLQLTDKPPAHGKFERIYLDQPRPSEVKGERLR